MEASFLAVLIVMVLLIGFVLVILSRLSAAAGVRIRADMTRLLQSYDKVLETKSREICCLQAEAERLTAERQRETEQAVAAAAPAAESVCVGEAVVPPTATYRPSDFAEGYHAVRKRFQMTDEACARLIEQVVGEQAQLQPGRGPLAKRLRESLSFDTVFRLAQLQPEEQLEVLDTALGDEEWTLLRDFCEEREGQAFQITRFYDWVTELAEVESGEVLVRTGTYQDEDRLDSGGHSHICEGVQIVAGDRLYDYSINEREIS